MDYWHYDTEIYNILEPYNKTNESQLQILKIRYRRCPVKDKPNVINQTHFLVFMQQLSHFQAFFFLKRILKERW